MSSFQDERTYEAQARIITKLNEKVRFLTIQNDRMRSFVASGIVYEELQKAIAEHDTLQSEWVGFMATMKMCNDTFEADIEKALGKLDTITSEYR